MVIKPWLITSKSYGNGHYYIIFTSYDKLSNATLLAKVVGIYRSIMKSGADKPRASCIQKIMDRINKGILVIAYESGLKDGAYYNPKVVKDLDAFKQKGTVIIANLKSVTDAALAYRACTRYLIGSS